MLAIANTLFWSEVGKGRIHLYRDGNKQFATREELERYERERREAALQVKHAPRAVRGRKGVQPLRASTTQ
jgi:hypothetical protein